MGIKLRYKNLNWLFCNQRVFMAYPHIQEDKLWGPQIVATPGIADVQVWRASPVLVGKGKAIA